MTKRDLSKSKCVSISGSVPLPIEPKPIMTMGPVMRACTDEALDGIINLQIVGECGPAKATAEHP